MALPEAERRAPGAPAARRSSSDDQDLGVELLPTIRTLLGDAGPACRRWALLRAGFRGRTRRRRSRPRSSGPRRKGQRRMVSLTVLFGMFVALFAVIGAMRGWAKELLVTSALVLGLFLNAILDNYITPYRTAMLLQPPLTQFALRGGVLLLMALFGYQTPEHPRPAAQAGARARGGDPARAGARRAQRIPADRLAVLLPRSDRLPDVADHRSGGRLRPARLRSTS